MIDATIKKALRTIIFTQCLGITSMILLSNGFMLAYLARLGIPGYRILFLLSLSPLIGMLLILPMAYIADRHGKKKIGAIGLIISIIGYLMLPLAGFSSSAPGKWIGLGLLIYAMGITINSSSWFALLSPIIPEEIRGRFFGKLRMTFRTVGLLFSLGIICLLRLYPDLLLFQLILFIATLLLAARFFFYIQIPELEPDPSPNVTLMEALRTVLRIPHYPPFCSYLFLLSLCVGATPWLFGLLQKEVLGFSDSQLVLMGNLLGAGAIFGFYIGGKMVDSFSTKPVFLTGHLSFAGVLFLLVLRDFIPLPSIYTVGLLSFLFGTVQGAHGIAASSEMLALIPKENKSLSTGLSIALISAGIAFSGLLSGQILKLNLLRTEWLLLRRTLSAYDTLLLGSGVMIVLLSVTLSLVPSVLGIRSQWAPQNR